MRTLTATALATIATKRGEEPITIVEIDWSGILTGTYCNAQDYESIDDRLTALSGLDYGTKLTGSGISATMSLSLDDTDGTIKTILGANNAYLAPVRVYQSFRSLVSGTDRFLVFEGQINSPIKWGESDRIISLSIISKIEDGQYGFAPEEGTFTCLLPNSVGKAWPLAYGSPIRCKAAKVSEAPNGIIQTPYNLITLNDMRNLHPLITAVDLAKADKVQFETNNPLISGPLLISAYSVIIQVYKDSLVALSSAVDKLVGEDPSKENDVDNYIEQYRTLRDGQQAIAEGEQTVIQNGSDLAESNREEANVLALKTRENLETNPAADVITQFDTMITNEQDQQTALTDNITLLNTVTLPNLRIQEEIDILALQATLENIIEVGFTTIEVDNADCFPQSPTVTNCVINNTVVAGIFAGSRFLRTSGFNRLYNNITFGTRDNDNPNEFWITSSVRIKGMYCLINRTGTPSYSVCYVTEQVGDRCFFEPPLYSEDANGVKTPFLPDGSNGHIDEVAGTVLPDWLTQVMTGDDDLTGFANLPGNDWQIRPGDSIRVNTSFATKFVANMIPSTSVREVLAYRTDSTGRKRLSNVPSSYYSIDLSESIAGQSATTITLQQPLAYFNDEQWEEDIYVTLDSSIGPNTANIIDDLLTRFANSVTFNAASKAALVSALANYPMHFCIARTGDVLSLISELCWQARCGAFVDGGELFVKYLSAEVASVFTFDTANIQLQSASIELTKTEQLVTDLTANWQAVHADILGDNDRIEHHVTIRNNIPIYGEFKSEYDFFSYNIESLVLKSLLFWAIRYSMIWNYVTLTAHLDTLSLQLYDTVQINTTFYTGLGIVDSMNYDIGNNSVTYKIWTPLRSGESVEYPAAWPSTTAGTWPTVTDLYATIGDSNGN